MLLVFWRSKLVYCSQKSLLNIFNSCKSLAILGKLSYFIHANNSQVILNKSKFCAGRIYRWFFWPFIKRQNAKTMKLNSNVYISVWQTLSECLWAAGIWQKVRNGFNLHSQPFEYFKSSLAFAESLTQKILRLKKIHISQV